MATALVTQIAYAVQTLFDPAGTAGRLVDLGKLANYGLLTNFTPAYLFTTGVNGVWYDPSDLTTLFQDAAGTTPVTAVEQPVGLMLDKSKGLVLGSERAPAFANYDTVLTGTWAASGGNYAFTDTVGSQSRPGVQWPSASAIVGWYQVTVVVASITGATQIRLDGIGATDRLLVVGTNTFVANITTSSRLRFRLEDLSTIAGDGFAITSVSVRELPGNHAFNSSGNSANFPVLSARYNINTGSSDFSSGWVLQGTATKTGENVVNTPANNDWIFKGVSPVYAGQTVTYSALLSGSGTATLVLYDNVSGFSGVITVTLTSTPTRYSITKTFGTGAVDLRFGVGRITGATATAITASDHDLRVTNDALNQPAYQRVNTTTDYDTVGFKPYLKFNGTNQWLQTNSIDFTYGDKMFVCAGVRKLSDAAAAVPFELSVNGDSNTGTFQVNAPSGIGSNNIVWFSYGTSKVGAAASGIVSPVSSVMSGIGSISGPESTIRINGVQITKSTASQGTGNYGNYPLYIGARAGTSLWFNGRLHQLVVAGKAASVSEIGQTEAFTNQKTGAY